MNDWRILRQALDNEAEPTFETSGEVIVVSSDSDSDTGLVLVSRTKLIHLKWVPQRNAVRWDISEKYGFELIQPEVRLLARNLMKGLQAAR